VFACLYYTSHPQTLPFRRQKITSQASSEQRQRFIVDKYQHRRFFQPRSSASSSSSSQLTHTPQTHTPQTHTQQQQQQTLDAFAPLSISTVVQPTSSTFSMFEGERPWARVCMNA
jgi:hypothetical protein